jgi:hypothetical protein
MRPAGHQGADVDPVALWIEGLSKALAEGDDGLVTSFRMALVAYGARAVPALSALVRDRDRPEALRRQALTALAEMKAAGRLSLALDLLDRPDEPSALRAQALAVAAEAAGAEAHALAQVRDAMGPGRPLPERVQAIEIVHRADPRAALPAVTDLLGSADPAERAWAAQFLGQVSHPDWRPLLRQALAAGVGNRGNLLGALARTKGRSWSADQIVGEPDTEGYGDLTTAWASKAPDMGEVTIELDYEVAVRPDAVRVRETFNPGAVARIETRDGARWVVLWEGVAPTTSHQATWFEPRLSPSGPTRTLRLVLDTNRVQGWNEIDAVELVGDGRRQWASSARASSSYADP